MEIDRKLQHNLLFELKQAYPNGLTIDYLYFKCVEEQTPQTDTFEQMLALLKMPKDVTAFQHLKANLVYLAEHQLIADVTENNTAMLKATVKGVDFVENDGGLSAILNTVCVSYHADTMAQLGALLSQLDKPSLRDLIRRLPVEIATSLIQAFPAVCLAIAES